VRLSPETCRVKPFRRIKTQLLHLVGLISLPMPILILSRICLGLICGFLSKIRTHLPFVSFVIRFLSHLSLFITMSVLVKPCKDKFHCVSSGSVHREYQAGVHLRGKSRNGKVKQFVSKHL